MTCTGSGQVQDPDLRDSAEREDAESGAAAHRRVRLRRLHVCGVQQPGTSRRKDGP